LSIKEGSKNIRRYVEQQQDQRRAVQHRHQIKFHEDVEEALLKKRAAEASARLSKTHAKYLLEKKKSTSAIRLKQTRTATEPARRKNLIARAVKGEWTGTRPQSRIKPKEEEARVRREKMEFERERRRKEEKITNMGKEHLDQVVEESMMDPAEVAKRRNLEDRWRKYKRSQEVMREAVRIKEREEEEARRKRVVEDEEENRLKREEEDRKFLEADSEDEENFFI
jgi:trichohyalin